MDMGLVITREAKKGKTSSKRAGVRYYNSKQRVLKKNYGLEDDNNESGNGCVDLYQYFRVAEFADETVKLFKTDDVLDFLLETAETKKAAGVAFHLLAEPIPNAYKYIQALRSLVFDLVQRMLTIEILHKAEMEELEQLNNGVEKNKGKRWTAEQDELLIEHASQENNIYGLAQIFGRSPSAIQSRLTYLVGIKRVSKQVAGKFVGIFNGVETSGHINGTVTS